MNFCSNYDDVSSMGTFAANCKDQSKSNLKVNLIAQLTTATTMASIQEEENNNTVIMRSMELCCYDCNNSYGTTFYAFSHTCKYTCTYVCTVHSALFTGCYFDKV